MIFLYTLISPYIFMSYLFYFFLLNHRAFVKPDVPTAVCKAAPDICSVYVIAKGTKLVSVRPASRPHNSIKSQNIRFSGEIESTGNTTFQSVKSLYLHNT
jgi:hypothetical protein